jgi:cobalt/nickel transport system permease protein
MTNIDKYAYASKLKDIDPMEKLIFALLTLVVCLWADSIVVSIIVLLVMARVTIQQGGIPRVIFLKVLLIPMTFIIVAVIAIAINIASQPIGLIVSIPVFSYYLGVSETGVIMALHLFFRALGAASCLFYLSLNTPMVDIMSALRRLKCPKLLVEMMGLVYRFIFVLVDTARTMYTAQSSRLGYSTVSSGYRSMAALVATVFIRSYQQADRIYTSLESRGYDGEINVLEEPKKFYLRRYLMALSINTFLVLLTFFI